MVYAGGTRDLRGGELPISERQLEVAYYEANRGEIGVIIEENDRPVEYWQRKYPDLKITVREF